MAIVFDMDGTLLESMPMWSGVGDRYLESIGVPLKRETKLVVTDKTYNEKTQELIDLYGLDISVKDIKLKFDELAEVEYRERLQLKPYVREFLQQCREAGIRMAVATATASHLALACFERLDILQYFDTVLSTRDTGVNKFQPDIYLRCAAQLNSTPGETTVFEDALYAAKTAFDAGFTVVGVYDDVFADSFACLAQVSHRTVKSFQELLRKHK